MAKINFNFSIDEDKHPKVKGYLDQCKKNGINRSDELCRGIELRMGEKEDSKQKRISFWTEEERNRLATILPDNPFDVIQIQDLKQLTQQERQKLLKVLEHNMTVIDEHLKRLGVQDTLDKEKRRHEQASNEGLDYF